VARVEISPEPTPEEREALLLALGAVDGSRYETSPWWEAGVREATDEDPEEVAKPSVP
jgi:hypothetical protein